MAASDYHTTQYSAENFVESAGAILFHRSTRRICLIHHQTKNEWLLAKGRRNVGETCSQAALREVIEETGFSCRLLPVTMATRAPPAVETGHSPDKVRVHNEVSEPFMLTCRHLDDYNIKLIMWFIAEIDEETSKLDGEELFKAKLFSFSESIEKLTFELDRDVVRKAIEIFTTSYKT